METPNNHDNARDSDGDNRQHRRRDARPKAPGSSLKVLKRVDYRYLGAQAHFKYATAKSVTFKLGFGAGRFREMVEVFEQEFILRAATVEERSRHLTAEVQFEREKARLENMRLLADVHKVVLPEGMVGDGVPVFALFPNGLIDVSLDPYMLQLEARGYKLSKLFIRGELVIDRGHIFVVFEKIKESPYSAEVQAAVIGFLRNNVPSHLVVWDNRDTAGTILLEMPCPRGDRVVPKHYLQLMPFEIVVGADGKRSYAPGVKPSHVFQHVVLTPEDYCEEQGIELPVAEKKAPPVKDVEGLKAKGVDPIVSSRWEGNEAPLLPRPSIY